VDGNMTLFAGTGTSQADFVAPLTASLFNPTVMSFDAATKSLYFVDRDVAVRVIVNGSNVTTAAGTYASTSHKLRVRSGRHDACKVCKVLFRDGNTV
jgi:hypothetical protein